MGFSFIKEERGLNNTVPDIEICVLTIKYA
jgi:hypothetical protein